jgi:hypothetical protein
LCASRCSDCGVLCESFPITDAGSLGLYSGQACNVLVGDVYISNLPTTINEDVLFSSLQSVQEIRGGLYVKDNLYLTSLSCMRNVRRISGGVYYVNNPNLVDTRMPLLGKLGGAVVVDGCDRMCGARYTTAVAVPDDPTCTNLKRLGFFHFNGPRIPANVVALTANVTAIALRSISNGIVCDVAYT